MTGNGPVLARVVPAIAFTMLGIAVIVLAALAGSWPYLLPGLAVAAISVWDGWRGWRVIRSDVFAARRDLIRAIKTLDADQFYLARDAHLLFTRHRIWATGAPLLCVDRQSEDDFAALEEEGSGVISSTCFRVDALSAHVIVRTDAKRLRMNGENPEFEDERRQSPVKWLTGMVQAARMLRTGAAYASKDELRELVAQIRSAEPQRVEGEAR